jgi:allantoicase
LAEPSSGDLALALPDLASRLLRGSVIAASDEFFAEKENLINPSPPSFTPGTYGHKGQLYDGWETRRRRGPSGALPGPDDHDWAVVRLGAAGVVRAVVVDTAFFSGNYPASCAVDGCWVSGYPASLSGCEWVPLVARTRLKGDSRHVLEVSSQRRFTHVRLRIYPDGGVARLRVHGLVVCDPCLVEGLTFDLAALSSGGDVVACSDQFYSSPRNVLSPGFPQVMGDGWETRRRRSAGNEWIIVRLAGLSVISLAEIDTSLYVGNPPGAASLLGLDASSLASSFLASSFLASSFEGSLADPSSWFPLLPRTELLPDTPHRFRLADSRPVTHVRLDVFPDGGIARLRLYGSLTEAGLAQVRRRWEETALALVVEGGQVEPADALGVDDRVDFRDLAA